MREFTNADLATADAQRATLCQVQEARAYLVERAAEDLASLVLLEAVLTDLAVAGDLGQFGSELIQQVDRAFSYQLSGNGTELVRSFGMPGAEELNEEMAEDALAVCRRVISKIAQAPEEDDDPRCVCGTARSEHQLCGCPDGLQAPVHTVGWWACERIAARAACGWCGGSGFAPDPDGESAGLGPVACPLC